ncbi:MAG: sigma-54 factor interaction domain-containing protein, partial [Oscillospiraceae bacterium]
GKEMFAQSIHNASRNMAGDFVPINCAAIPENLLESMLFGTVKGAFTGAIDSAGFFEKAEKGTIFLDEINSMPIALQAKILRVLQEKEVQRIGDSKTKKINCRIISATNKLPADAIRAGELR